MQMPEPSPLAEPIAAETTPSPDQYAALPSAKDRSLEEIVDNILLMPPREKLTFRDLIDLFGEQSMYMALFLFSFPVAIPFIGLDIFMSVLGLPVFLMGFWMVKGINRVWIPPFAAKREIEFDKMQRIVRMLKRWLNHVDDYIKPRLPQLSSRKGEMAIGLALMPLSLALFDIFGLGWMNTDFIPPAMALFAFGLIFRDGYVIAAGWASVAIAIVWGALAG
jgi:hypothetical protein